MFSGTVSLNSTITYCVEERLATSPTEVNHAWNHDTREEAIDRLIANVAEHGATRLYTAYTLVG